MIPQTPATFTLAEGVVAAFTDRAQGNLAHRRPHVPGQLHAARRVLAGALGVEVGDLHHMHQVHGGDVGIIDDATPTGAEVRGVDALVTDTPGRALVVQAADCVPVLAAYDDGPIGVAHAGRGGVESGVVPNLVGRLAELRHGTFRGPLILNAGPDGSSSNAPDRTSGLHVAIGPAIGPCCYEVPEAMAAEVAAATGLPQIVSQTTWGTPSLDLPAAVEAQVRDAGVSDVRPTPGCTRCDEQGRWFSHRLDPSTGRHAGVVVLTAESRAVAA